MIATSWGDADGTVCALQTSPGPPGLVQGDPHRRLTCVPVGEPVWAENGVWATPGRPWTERSSPPCPPQLSQEFQGRASEKPLGSDGMGDSA